MERCRKAIQLCTGDRATDRAIANWLEQYGVEITACADAFEACTLALTRPEPSPDLAVIGADWLAPNELAIISYLREIWPGLITVVYGSPSATAGLGESPQEIVCRSPVDLRRILSDPPDALLERSVEALRSQMPDDDGWRPRPVAPPAGGGRNAEGRARRVIAELDLGVGKQDPVSPGVDRVQPPAEILTPEELAALLQDEEP